MYHNDGPGNEHRDKTRARLRRAGLAGLAPAAAARWQRRGGRVAALSVRRVGVTLGLAGCVLIGAVVAAGGAGSQGLSPTRQQRRVMTSIRSQEDGIVHSARLPRTTPGSS